MLRPAAKYVLLLLLVRAGAGMSWGPRGALWSDLGSIVGNEKCGCWDLLRTARGSLERS